MPNPYSYVVPQADVGSYFDAMRQGREDRLAVENEQKTNALSKYLPQALNGDEQARTQAMSFGTPDQQIALKQRFMELDEQKLATLRRNQSEVAAMAVNATDPTSWAAVNARAKQLDPTAQEIPFEQRAMVIAKAQTVAEALKAAHDEKVLANDTRQTDASINASNASAAASYALANQRKNPGAGGIDNTTFDNMSGLRREFTQATKTYSDVRDAFGRIQASAKNPSAAGDLSLIFNYMKVLDPGSTVREGEFATAQNATGVPERIVNAYNQAINGQRLNPEQRTDFVNRAGMLFNRQHQTYLATKGNYDKLATRFGFDPSLVTFDQSGGIQGPPDTPAPAPTVQRPPATPAPAARPTATGPNGEKLILSEDGKRWVPVR